MIKRVSKKKPNEPGYDDYLMYLFWSISIPIYVLCVILSIIFRHIFPLMIIVIIYLTLVGSSIINYWLYWRLKVIFSNKYARLFRILWLIPFVLVLYYNYGG